jgi:hypothetical protein
MRNRASSFPAERGAPRWYREPWPWLLIAGPLFVVAASLASAWIAMRSDDGVVADDYYKQGLSINRKLKHVELQPARPVGATITVAAHGEVSVAIEGLAEPPSDLRLELVRPGVASSAARVALNPGPDGDYVGQLPQQSPGRWIVTLESRTWRLPTTVTEQLADIRLGSAERRRAPGADQP